jgi:1-acyl-sn-glycerol-3-phosphate acyltransferase
MPALYDRNITKPWRKAVYMATELGLLAPLFVLKHRLTITGRESVPAPPFVAVANHLSKEDPPLLAVAVRRPVAFIAKQELYAVPILRSLILFYGAISIDRDKPEVSTFKAVKEVCQHGWALGMFIEGTRSKTPGMLGAPYEGPAYFAWVLRAPIVPVGIVGTDNPWGKAYARIGKPIDPDRDLDKITWDIMQSLSDLTGFTLPPRSIRPRISSPGRPQETGDSMLNFANVEYDAIMARGKVNATGPIERTP